MRKSIQKQVLVLLVTLLAALAIYGAGAFQGSTPEVSPGASPVASPVASPAATPAG